MKRLFLMMVLGHFSLSLTADWTTELVLICANKKERRCYKSLSSEKQLLMCKQLVRKWDLVRDAKLLCSYSLSSDDSQEWVTYVKNQRKEVITKLIELKDERRRTGTMA